MVSGEHSDGTATRGRTSTFAVIVAHVVDVSARVAVDGRVDGGTRVDGEEVGDRDGLSEGAERRVEEVSAEACRGKIGAGAKGEYKAARELT